MHFSISLIIPTDRVDSSFQQCLQRIEKCIPPPQEVIVVIDGDNGQVLPDMKELEVKTVRLPVRGGPGRARDKGAEVASGDILLFIDSDVLVPEDICLKIDKAFCGDSKPDAVFGSYDDKPSAQNTVSQYKNLLHHYTHQHSNNEAFTFWSGCGALLRSRFIELNGFGNDYTQPSIEDIELGYRLKDAGGTILLDKSIQVTHLKNWSFVNMLRTDFFQRAIPWSRLILRYKSMPNDMNINLSSRVSVVLCFLVVSCLLLSMVKPFFFSTAILFFFLFLSVNRNIFLFFQHKKGILFSLQAIPLHFLYFLVSGLAFAMVFLQQQRR